MFDSLFTGRVATALTTFGSGSGSGSGPGRFVEDASTSPFGTSPFGDISSYGLCAGCGRFHGVVDAGDGAFGNVNADERGGVGPNGKPSLGPIDAGMQLTRANAFWGTTMGQPVTVTFAFRATQAATMPNGTDGFSQFTQAQITATLLALQSWSDVANITFQRVTDPGSQYSNSAVMLFGNYNSGAEGAAAFAYLPGNASHAANSGDVWINNSYGYNAIPVLNAYGYQVLTHEIGHAIGLLHPADYNAGPGVNIQYGPHAIYFEDSRQYSVMSYFAETETGGYFIRWEGNTGFRQYSSAPLMDDIAAAQRLYGANMTTRTGDTVYGFNSNADRPWYAPDQNGFMIFSVWDAGGNDTFDFSGYTMNQMINLRQGAFSDVGGLVGNVSIALGVTIENAIGGSGNDIIYGNSADNVLTGGAGDDYIDGGLGIDTVVFSGNRSQYTITWNGNIGTVVGPDGTDTITNVEFLRFADMTIAAAPTGGVVVSGDMTNETINGTAYDDEIYGMGGNDVIHGGAGNDYLNGGAGNDVLNGGDGDDVLVGGTGNNTLNGGAGHDTADYSGARGGIIANLATGQVSQPGGTDTLTSIEEVIGSRYADVITGGAGDDVLRGGGGADVLNGGGGNDRLYAGAPEVVAAPDIIKPSTTANNSIANAISVDGFFDLEENPDIVNSTTIPHATVVATAHGGAREYYAFTVASTDVVTFDIDGASFDTVIRLLDANGNQLAINDDALQPDGQPTDSGMTFSFFLAGTYYIEVSRWASGSGPTVQTAAPPAGGTYTLHISIPSAPPVAPTLQGSTLNGEAGDDELFGGIGPDILNGGSGNDRLMGGGGNNTLIGGEGYDVAVYSGAYRGYTTARVDQVSGGREGGTDTLTEMEAAEFIDGTLTFNADSQAAQLMRLYSAAFGREPDDLGFEIQLNALEAGVSMEEMASRFIASDEFVNTYGALTDRQFIDRLYLNALNREGEPAGINSWLVFLANGGTRAELMLIFAESAEHRALTWSTLAEGLWVGNDNAAAVARLYDGIYDRIPDQEGLITWTQALNGGMSLLAIATAFLATSEGQAIYGGLTNAQFVDRVYQTVLNRAGDPGGIAAYLAGLNAGTITRAEMLLEFTQSAEHRALTTPLYVNGIPVTFPPSAPVAEDEVPQVLPAAEDDAALDATPAKFDPNQPQILPGQDALVVKDGDDAPQVLPSDDVVVEAKSDTSGPQVLPLAEDDFILPASDSKYDDGPQVLPAAEPDLVVAKGDASGPQVLPLAEDDFVLVKTSYEDVPQVLVGAEEDLVLEGVGAPGSDLRALEADLLVRAAGDNHSVELLSGQDDWGLPEAPRDPWGLA